ncbi:MAG: glycyl-radical enzyme activating protein [Anaerolineaceae bacterium]|nr:glycyl-radical enzyme activating protein [Anaerolineaceae bacterium]
MILQIQRFSLDDGPGIRTTVFFKGCNLHCLWCHNPESISPQVEIAFQRQRCTSCGACSAVCPNDAQICDERGRFLNRSACTACLSCVSLCPSEALSVYGQEMTTDKVMETILRDRPFYAKSGGGVTFSGGEPLLHPGSLLTLLQMSRDLDLHTAVDTAGNVPFEYFLTVQPYTNLFLFDIKAFDPGLHRRLTGVDNGRILKNLMQLGQLGARVWVRLPFIPNLNNDRAEIKAIAALLKDIPGVEKVELLPYHAYGESKYEFLGIDHNISQLPTPTRDEVLGVLNAYQAQGLPIECSTL